MARIYIDIDEKNIETIIKGINSLNDISDIVSNLSTGVPVLPVQNTISDNISKTFSLICGKILTTPENRDTIEEYIDDKSIPLEAKVTKLYGDILKNGDQV